MRLHIYLSDAQYNGLRELAKSQGYSLSRAVRGMLPLAQNVRAYNPDGQHTAEQREQRAIAHILRRAK